MAEADAQAARTTLTRSCQQSGSTSERCAAPSNKYLLRCLAIGSKTSDSLAPFLRPFTAKISGLALALSGLLSSGPLNAQDPNTPPNRWQIESAHLSTITAQESSTLDQAFKTSDASFQLQSASLLLTLNAGGTLSDGAQAFTLKQNSGNLALVDPAAAQGVFGLGFQTEVNREPFTIAFVNASPPDASALPLVFELAPPADDPGESGPLSASANFRIGPLTFLLSFTLSDSAAEWTERLSVQNDSSSAVTELEWLTCFNPAPDLSRDGSTDTRNMASQQATALLLATGSSSGRTVGLAWNQADEASTAPHTLAVGFCPQSATGAEEPGEIRFESAATSEADQLLGARLSVPELLPGEAVVASQVVLVADSQIALIQAWNGRFDRDNDGFSPNAGDCDDSMATVNPAQSEKCDGLDNDCNGITDDRTICLDDDGDGYTELQGDCDDALAQVHPGALEGSVSTNGLVADGLDNDCDGQIDENTNATDDDLDGFTELEGDCDDANANAYPQAEEDPYNGQDEDCDGVDIRDLDGDGYESVTIGGTDCYDSDPLAHPGVTDPPQDAVPDGLDQDCDGIVDEDAAQPDDILINEILYDPLYTSDRQGEFIELINPTQRSIQIQGWTLSNAVGQFHRIDTAGRSLIIDPGQVILLAISSDTTLNGALNPDYTYQGITLANGSDTLSLRVDDQLISQLHYGSDSLLPDVEGASLQRTPACAGADAGEARSGDLAEDAASRDPTASTSDAECWCASLSPWVKGDSSRDLGSPGAPNSPCAFDPLADQDGDGVAAAEFGGTDCLDQSSSVYPGAPEVPYDGIDQDCDGHDLIDQDGDGFASADDVSTGTDCDDLDSTRYPRAPEDGGTHTGLSNGVDDNCNGVVDDGCLDIDDDLDGYTEVSGDCDDLHAEVYPQAPEIEDGLDNDCDGNIDPFWRDNDDDGFSEAEGDCDDANSALYPSASDIPDGIDEDCDGDIDEGSSTFDDDGDGYSELEGDCDDTLANIHPNALDECADGLDQNCDGIRPECEPMGGGCSVRGDPHTSESAPHQWLSALAIWGMYWGIYWGIYWGRRRRLAASDARR